VLELDASTGEERILRCASKDRLLASHATSYVTGAQYTVGGGMEA